jgi:hypothetical protein
MDIADLTWPSGIPRLLWMHRECPLCSSIEFSTAESHPLDRLMRLFSLTPIRCINCWRRYYWFSNRRARAMMNDHPGCN